MYKGKLIRLLSVLGIGVIGVLFLLYGLGTTADAITLGLVAFALFLVATKRLGWKEVVS